MGRYFGGRYGKMLLPTASASDTQAVLSIKDHYYMRVSSVNTIADLNSQVDNWTAFPNGGNYTTSYSDSNYYGARNEVSGGNGRFRANSYEYSLYTKFSCRLSSAHTGVFQIHDYGGTLTNFNDFYGGTDPGNFFMMGVIWVDPTTMYQTNSVHAKTNLSAGDGVYMVSGGTGSRTWGWFNGGANSNANGQGSTNREAQTTVNWANQEQLTILVYGDAHPTFPNKIRMFHGESLAREWTQTIPNNKDNVYMLFGYGYPSGLQGKYDDLHPLVRYGSLSNSVNHSI